MKKRLLTLLLALALAVSLALPAAAAQTPVEVSSALVHFSPVNPNGFPVHL